MRIEDLIGTELTEELIDAETALNDAFLEDYGMGDYDWAKRLSKEEKTALSKVATFLSKLENYHVCNDGDERDHNMALQFMLMF